MVESNILEGGRIFKIIWYDNSKQYSSFHIAVEDIRTIECVYTCVRVAGAIKMKPQNILRNNQNQK